MNEMTNTEIWQVEVSGTIYEAPFEELGEWIAEGSLQPEDKVRKGSLRWAKARNVPILNRAFEAKAKGLPIPSFVTHPKPNVPKAATQTVAASTPNVTETLASEPVAEVSSPSTTNYTDPSVCANHRELESAYICTGCGSGFCKACPNAYGAVRTCPSCGSMCHAAREIAAAAMATREELANIAPGRFGFGDLMAAFAFPFRFRTSLVIGAIMFTFFSVGQAAAATGSLFLAGAALISLLLANMLSFGVLANTVTNFSQGRLGQNFMPDFENFSIWDDVIHPFFLSIGVYITSFGPFILVMIVAVYMAFSAINTQMTAYQSQIERLPGTPYYSPNRTVEQSEDVRKLLGEIGDESKERTAYQTELAAGNTQAAAPQTEEEQMAELMKVIEQNQKERAGSIAGPTDAERAAANAQVMSAILSVAAPVIVLSGLALLWALFFFPAACAVAGYTRSFFAVINPLVGLDTIRRLGRSYFVLLLMAVLLLVISTVVSTVVALVLSPFDLPSLGNIPARIVFAPFGFYLTIVFSCLLGYAMYKSADKLNISR